VLVAVFDCMFRIIAFKAEEGFIGRFLHNNGNSSLINTPIFSNMSVTVYVSRDNLKKLKDYVRNDWS